MLWSADVVAREELNLRPLPCQEKTSPTGAAGTEHFPQVNGRLGCPGQTARSRECPVEHAPGAPSGILREHKSPPGRVLGGPVGCWLLGLQQPHVGGLGALRPRLDVELDGLPLIK
jgi:hypothetical protein